MGGLSDGELMGLAAGGDGGAFSLLYDRHSGAVIRYAWALTSNSVDAQELLQETFITAWAKMKSVRLVDTSILPWLLVVCRNHSLNLARSQRRERTVPLDEVPDRGDNSVDDAERLGAVMEHINGLPQLDRRVCELCLIEGYTYAEAAEMLGVSVNVLAKRLERARTRLTKVLARG